MGYESEPLPSYNNVRTCCYFIILSYIYSTSTSQIRLPRFDLTISSSGSSLESTTPWYRAHRWGGMTPVPRWLPYVSECTPVWGIIPLLLAPPPPGDIPTFFRHPHNPSVRPVVKPLQDLQNFPRHHPTFSALQHHCMCHCFVHHPMSPHCCSHLCRHLIYHPPPSPHFLQVLEHCYPITIFVRDLTPKVG